MKSTIFTLLTLFFAYGSVYSAKGEAKKKTEEQKKAIDDLIHDTDERFKGALAVHPAHLTEKFADHYEEYLLAFDEDKDKDYINETQMKEKELRKKVYDALVSLTSTPENWHEKLDDVKSALVEHNEFVQGVFEKARESLKGAKDKEEEIKDLEHDNLKHKAENLRLTLHAYEDIFILISAEIKNEKFAEWIEEEVKKELDKTKQKLDELKPKILDLIRLVNEDKEKAKDHFKELKEKIHETLDHIKTALSKLFKNRKDNEAKYNAELQKKIEDLLENVTNVSRSFLPGFVAIALSLILFVA